MQKFIRLAGSIFFLTILILLAAYRVLSAGIDRQWFSPFSTGTNMESTGDTLSFEQCLQKVKSNNKTLRSADFNRQSLAGLTDQARLRINPELDFEIEDISGDLPGLSQTEWSLSLSQELEIWGRRSSRIESARVDSLAIAGESDILEFDIYIEFKRRYAELLNRQPKVSLLMHGYDLAEEMVAAAGRQVDMGAALAAEMQLAELEATRLQMDLNAARTDLQAAKSALAALWGSSASAFQAVMPVEFEMTAIDPAQFNDLVDGSRELFELDIELARIEAEAAIARAENRLNPTLTAGFKRLEGEKISSFLFGISLPLPFFDRNQGKLSELHSNQKAQKALIDQKRHEVKADLIAAYRQLYQLHERLVGLDKTVIPKAIAAFQVLKDTYDRGRLRYTELLEGRRLLMNLEQERSETWLECIYQMIEIEQTLGIKLNHINPEEVRP